MFRLRIINALLKRRTKPLTRATVKVTGRRRMNGPKRALQACIYYIESIKCRNFHICAANHVLMASSVKMLVTFDGCRNIHIYGIEVLRHLSLVIGHVRVFR